MPSIPAYALSAALMAAVVGLLATRATAQGPQPDRVVIGYLLPDSTDPRQLAFDRGARMAANEAGRAGELLRREVRLAGISPALSPAAMSESLDAARARIVVSPLLEGPALRALLRWTGDYGGTAITSRLGTLPDCSMPVLQVAADVPTRAAALTRMLASRSRIRRWYVAGNDDAEARRTMALIAAVIDSADVRPLPISPDRLTPAELERLHQAGIVMISTRAGVVRAVEAIARNAGALADPRIAPRPLEGGDWHAIKTWHPDLERFGARQLNDRFVAEYGAPMTSAAWEGWIAVKTAWEGTIRNTSPDLLGSIVSSMSFDGHKGSALRFGASDWILQQPLIVVRRSGADSVEAPAASGASAAGEIVAEVPWPTLLTDSTHPRLTRCAR